MALGQPSRPLRVILVMVVCAAALTACSRITIAYNAAGFFAKQYATDYLSLGGEQVARWEPRLDTELRRHRAQELPHLAAFFDRVLTASRGGFSPESTSCLTQSFRDLYRRHARLAVELASPLLADLRPQQIDELGERFRKESEEDKADLAKRDFARAKAKRGRRYVEAIEDWTGPLTPAQKTLVADITGRMPDSEAAVVDYRSRKREQLIRLLRRRAGEQAIAAFMTDWLVDFRDLPPTLDQAGDAIQARVRELLTRLGGSLDGTQRKHLHKRLETLRDDLMRLQRQPRMAPMQC